MQMRKRGSFAKEFVDMSSWKALVNERSASGIGLVVFAAPLQSNPARRGFGSWPGGGRSTIGWAVAFELKRGAERDKRQAGL